MSDGNDKVQSEEVVEENLTEGEGSATTDKSESAGVSDVVSREEFSRLEKQMREHQARADRAEARQKELERRDMSEVERLIAENQELQEQNRSYEVAYAQLSMEQKRNEMVLQAGLPAEAIKNVPISYDESEMRQAVDNLSKLLKATEAGKPAPLVAGGTPPAEPSVDALKAAREAKDPDAMIKAHREAQASRRQGG